MLNYESLFSIVSISLHLPLPVCVTLKCVE